MDVTKIFLMQVVGTSHSSGAGIVQLVERPIEKPGAVLTRVRVPGAARDFSSRVNFQCRLSYGVITSPSSPASLSVRTLKIPTLAAIALFGHTKILHTLIGMGSAALAAAVPYPGKATRISRKEQRSTKYVHNKNLFCY